VTVRQGCDYSYARPEPACLAKAGIEFVGRYASQTDPDRSMSHAEAVSLVEAGLAMVTIYQPKGEKGWMTTGGLDRGRSAAREALAVAEGHCGMPEDRPIYFTLDRDPATMGAAEWAIVADTLDGAAAVLGRARVGLYGAYDAMARFLGKRAAWGYQTSSWSGSQWYPGVHLQQYDHNVSVCGGLIDRVRATADDYGGWTDP
jgi:hypothetical protein